MHTKLSFRALEVLPHVCRKMMHSGAFRGTTLLVTALHLMNPMLGHALISMQTNAMFQIAPPPRPKGKKKVKPRWECTCESVVLYKLRFVCLETVQ